MPEKRMKENENEREREKENERKFSMKREPD